MANPQRGDVEIKLGDANYTIRPSFDAIARIEQRTGKEIMPLGRKFFNATFGLREAAIVIEEGIAAANGTAPKDIGDQLRSIGLTDMDMTGSLTTFFAYAVSGDQKGDETRDRVASDKAERERNQRGEAPAVV